MCAHAGRDAWGDVRQLLLCSPTPLFRARRLEKLLDTPARIYYKYEVGLVLVNSEKGK